MHKLLRPPKKSCVKSTNMIRVRIHINRTLVIDIHAVREHVWAGRNGYHRYSLYITNEVVDHDWIGQIRHKYSDGAAKLSAKMLRIYHKHMWEKEKE
jgi:hypothetical protein